MKSLLSILLFLTPVLLSNLYSQTETEKKIIILEYQIKELKEQNEQLMERVLALEIQLKEFKQTSNVSTPTSINSSQSKTIPKATTGGRCTAITQAGTQCKRSAQAGRNRCWQH